MPMLTVDEVQPRLSQIIDALKQGEELVISRGDKPVARLLPWELTKGMPIFGRGQGKVLRMIDDDDHLKDFSESLE